MATGRTVEKYKRAYVDGYDVSGQARSFGPHELDNGEAELTAWTDTVKGYLKNSPHANVGTLNAVFDNTATTGGHTVLKNGAGTSRTVLVAIGIQAAPAQGDPTFGGQFMQGEYTANNDGGAVVVNCPFMGWANDATSLLFATPFGVLLHANTAATAANSASGVDNPTAGATTKGGYLVYQVTAGDGTATISVDDSANDSSFTALSGATTGSIDCATVKYGLVALSPTATVRRYLRWQIALGTATTVTFALSFHRAF